MTGLEFTSALIEHVLSWPVAVVVAVLVLREPLKSLIPRIDSWEGMGQKLKFGERLAETEEVVNRAVGSISPSERLKDSHPNIEVEPLDSFDVLSRAAEDNPSYAVISAWEQFSGALNDLIGAVAPGQDLTRSARPALQLRELSKRSAVTQDFVDAANRLRFLRNEVAHGQAKPTAGEAIAYVESARELANAAIALARLASKNERRQSEE